MSVSGRLVTPKSLGSAGSARADSRLSKRAFAPATARLAPSDDLAGLESLCDTRGLRRGAAYLLDDNAVALQLMVRLETIGERRRGQGAALFAALLRDAWDEENGRFRRALTADGRSDQLASDEGFGRALWALGAAAGDLRGPALQRWARALFDAAAPHASALETPAAWAYAMLGAASILDADPEHDAGRAILVRFGEQLQLLLAETRRPDPRWFEIMVGHDTPRLAEALIRAGALLGDDALAACGLSTLEWVLAGSCGATHPLGAAALADACAAAWRATGDRRWCAEARDIALPAGAGIDPLLARASLAATLARLPL